jgi:hypothetical protein
MFSLEAKSCEKVSKLGDPFRFFSQNSEKANLRAKNKSNQAKTNINKAKITKNKGK